LDFFAALFFETFPCSSSGRSDFPGWFTAEHQFFAFISVATEAVSFSRSGFGHAAEFVLGAFFPPQSGFCFAFPQFLVVISSRAGSLSPGSVHHLDSCLDAQIFFGGRSDHGFHFPLLVQG
jgi:hypothetical protein